MLKLRDIMTRDVITLTPEVSLREAMELLATRHVSGVPVVVGRKVVGVITATDLMAFASTMVAPDGDDRAELADAEAINDSGTESWSWDDENGPAAAYFSGSWDQNTTDVVDHFGSLARPMLDLLGEYTVGEAMTARICSLPSSATVTEAAEYMRRSGIHRVLVVDGDDLMGIVSTMDITKVVADHGLVARTYVFRDAGRIEPAGVRHYPHLGARLQHHP